MNDVHTLALELDRVYKTIDRKSILQDVTLRVNTGEVFGFL